MHPADLGTGNAGCGHDALHLVRTHGHADGGSESTRALLERGGVKLRAARTLPCRSHCPARPDPAPACILQCVVVVGIADRWRSRLIRVRLALAGFIGAALALVAAPGAWACVPGSASGTLAVAPAKVQPGQEVAVSGVAAGSGPVVIRLNATEGAPLASLVPAGSGKGAEFTGRFTVPVDATPGESVVIATQDGRTWRTTIAVQVANGAPLPPAPAAPPIPRGSTGTSRGLLLAGGGGAAILLGAILSSRRRKRRHEPGDGPGTGRTRDGSDQPIVAANARP